jgi:hypothetical protein
MPLGPQFAPRGWYGIPDAYAGPMPSTYPNLGRYRPESGFVTIDRQRVQVGPYNVPMYTVREGGRVISVTRQQPRVLISR